MQATKYKVTVEVEVLSLDVVPSLLTEIANNIDNENISGSLLKDDGDSCKWETCSELVNF